MQMMRVPPRFSRSVAGVVIASFDKMSPSLMKIYVRFANSSRTTFAIRDQFWQNPWGLSLTCQVGFVCTSCLAWLWSRVWISYLRGERSYHPWWSWWEFRRYQGHDTRIRNWSRISHHSSSLDGQGGIKQQKSRRFVPDCPEYFMQSRKCWIVLLLLWRSDIVHCSRIIRIFWWSLMTCG